MSKNYILFGLLVAGFYCAVYGDHMVRAPRYTVDLDMPPETRWNDVFSHFNVTEYREGISKIFQQMVPSEAWPLVDMIASDLDQYLPQPYSAEIAGIAKTTGLDVGEMVMLNVFYDVSAYCTSIVAQDSNDTIWHGRNLDFFIGTDALRNITLSIDFKQFGKTVYTTTSYLGQVGAFTGQKPKAFTLSINQRNRGNIAENILEMLNAIILKKSVWVSFMFRDTLANDTTYQDAFNRLVTKQQVAPVYYTIGGIYPGEGAVITRDRTKALDVWQLDAHRGRWYLLETNYDHWEAPPPDDDRRDPGMKAMDAVGQNKINDKTLMKVLSVKPVLNIHTTYTTIMSAAQPDVCDAHVRYVDATK